MTEAYLLYSQASAMDPQNKTYWAHSQAALTRINTQPRLLPKVNLPGPDGATGR